MAQHKGEQHKARGRPIAGKEHQPQQRHHRRRHQPAQHRRPRHPGLPGLPQPGGAHQAPQPGQKAAAEHARTALAQVHGGQPHQRPAQNGQYGPEGIGEVDHAPAPEAEEGRQPDKQLCLQPHPAGEGRGPGPGGLCPPVPHKTHHTAHKGRGAAGEDEQQEGPQVGRLHPPLADESRLPQIAAVAHRQHHHGAFQPLGAGVHRLARQQLVVGRQQRPVAPGTAVTVSQRHRIAQGRSHPAVLPEGKITVGEGGAGLRVGQHGKEHLPAGQRPVVTADRLPRLGAQLGVLALGQGLAGGARAPGGHQRAVVEQVGHALLVIHRAAHLAGQQIAHAGGAAAQHGGPARQQAEQRRQQAHHPQPAAQNAGGQLTFFPVGTQDPTPPSSIPVPSDSVRSFRGCAGCAPSPCFPARRPPPRSTPGRRSLRRKRCARGFS